ncbi:ShlB/FhaC/HecB family hemolysin secretion/activation protein [Pseudomonas sp. BP8]|uniref:ShlB/FhaC/HecB family hemolysin secretion/activation protein n=1 Tax=Pseudomonas sp. BP8 TaxID=2817864 RepID=UPI001AE40C19|nr:ShlB/FhaC/HecB family hemolysin secretion/activation protein [Pseudomonas sp. BP8]MBP2260776.1 hemolysin activation/secretion protein [Pseudomonas sp. BP8]HDS1735487.1 ShlB/FhaC/HecB family hemolysin secretion/activation protein [Pseudomonas putida]
MSIDLSRTARQCLAALLLTLLLGPQALANDPASQQLREQQRSLRQIEQRHRLEQWQRRRLSPDEQQSPREQTPDSACWPVSGVRLTGNQLLSSATLEHTLRPLLHPCMGVTDLNRLLKAITERYVQAGYPTSRPYLARQPQAGAALELVVVEGFVESISLSDSDLPLSLRGAFPTLLGKPLYLPALEQGLDQLNRLRAYDLTASLLPGTLAGGTQVLVEPQRVGSRWHLDSQTDNRGSALTGRQRLNLGLGLDSPLNLNDDLRLSLNSAVLGAPGTSRGVSLYYSLPYGPWTFALNVSQLSYSAPLPGGQHVSSGSSRFQGASAERVLWRGQQGMLSASARLDRKQLINRLSNSPVGVQSSNLTTVESGINLLWLDGGLWNVYLGMAHGLAWLGADPPAAGPNHPQPRFHKYRANLLHLRQGPAQRPWRWQSELALQYSRDLLPAIEQQLQSDDSAVRGFRQYTVSGASGATWRNTLSQPLALSLPWGLQIRPALGLDLGWSRLAQGSPLQRLIGTSAGVELSLPGSRLRLDYQHPLYASDRPRQMLEPGFWVLDWTLSL